MRQGEEVELTTSIILNHEDKVRIGKKSLAIIKPKASTVKIFQNSTYILDLREPEILSGTLPKQALVVQFLKSKLINNLTNNDNENETRKPKLLKTRISSAYIAVSGTKFITYSSIKAGG
jgi:hypothetical protein